MRKCLRIAVLIVITAGVLFVGSGFSKRTDVCLVNYTASEDGSVVTMQTALAGSMGYIRAINTKWQDDAAYCSFYTAFGGLNSSIGAKNEFTLKLDDSVSKIYFDRGKEDEMLVLQRSNADGVWIQP